jgi:hypothetical protein
MSYIVYFFFFKGPQDGLDVQTYCEKDVSGDEGVSVTFETIKEDNTDGLRRRKESSKSEKDIAVGNEYEGKVEVPISISYLKSHVLSINSCIELEFFNNILVP